MERIKLYKEFINEQKLSDGESAKKSVIDSQTKLNDAQEAEANQREKTRQSDSIEDKLTLKKAMASTAKAQAELLDAKIKYEETNRSETDEKDPKEELKKLKSAAQSAEADAVIAKVDYELAIRKQEDETKNV
jgi:hypothetical protein